ESDNLAVKGVYWAREKRRVLSSTVEHHAVLDTVQWLEGHSGAQVGWLETDRLGRVHPEALAEAIKADPDSVAVATVMWANNEVGTINDIRALAEVAAEHGVPLHTDAVQAVG